MLTSNASAQHTNNKRKQVEGHTRSVLVAAPEKGEKGHPLVIETLKGAGE
jgi:hypothetical protein